MHTLVLDLGLPATAAQRCPTNRTRRDRDRVCPRASPEAYLTKRSGTCLTLVEPPVTVEAVRQDTQPSWRVEHRYLAVLDGLSGESVSAVVRESLVQPRFRWRLVWQVRVVAPGHRAVLVRLAARPLGHVLHFPETTRAVDGRSRWRRRTRHVAGHRHVPAERTSSPCGTRRCAERHVRDAAWRAELDGQQAPGPADAVSRHAQQGRGRTDHARRLSRTADSAHPRGGLRRHHRSPAPPTTGIIARLIGDAQPGSGSGPARRPGHAVAVTGSLRPCRVPPGWRPCAARPRRR